MTSEKDRWNKNVFRCRRNEYSDCAALFLFFYSYDEKISVYTFDYTHWPPDVWHQLHTLTWHVTHWPDIVTIFRRPWNWVSLNTMQLMNFCKPYAKTSRSQTSRILMTKIRNIINCEVYRWQRASVSDDRTLAATRRFHASSSDEGVRISTPCISCTAVQLPLPLLCFHTYISQNLRNDVWSSFT